MYALFVLQLLPPLPCVVWLDASNDRLLIVSWLCTSPKRTFGLMDLDLDR